MLTTCSVDGCRRPVNCRGLCLAHYTRVRRTGDVGSPDVSDRARKVCSVEGCALPNYARGMCLNHDRRVRKHGSTEYVPPMRYGPANGSWRGDDIGYTRAHQRVTETRGPANKHTCIDCSGQARHWCYNHRDPQERTTGRGYPYSVDTRFYDPRCVSCHKRFDLALRRDQRAS